MQRYVAFLRGINLGKRRPPMSRLRELFDELGFANVETFIASGNVLFSSRKKDRQKLETQIAQHLAKSLGYPVDTFIRTAAEVAAIAKADAFPDQEEPDVTVHVGFLHEKLPPKIAKELVALRTKEDAFQIVGREYYWLCRVRVSDSKVWHSPAMKALHLPSSSMRNLTTIRKLAAKHLLAKQPRQPPPASDS